MAPLKKLQYDKHFPNLQLIAPPEGFLMQRYIPASHDPIRCKQHVIAIAPRLRAGTRPPACFGIQEEAHLSDRPSRRHSNWRDPELVEKIGPLLWQGVDTTRRCRRGMQSLHFEAVRFFEQEQRNLHQFAVIDRYLAAGKRGQSDLRDPALLDLLAI